jgi:hypothetical protein
MARCVVLPPRYLVRDPGYPGAGIPGEPSRSVRLSTLNHRKAHQIAARAIACCVIEQQVLRKPDTLP